MENKNDTSKTLITGLVIGGLIGAAVVYCIQARKNHETPVMDKIGRTLSDVGELLGNCHLEKASDAVHKAEGKISSGADVVSNVTDWIDTGLKLWKHFKKG